MKKFALFALVALSLPVFVACGDNGPTEPEEDITGTYDLQTVNGESLPVVIDEGVEVVSQTMTINEDQTYTTDETYRVTQDGQQQQINESSSGTWQRSGDTITLFEEDGDEVGTGQLGNDSITVTFEADGQMFTLVFRK